MNPVYQKHHLRWGINGYEEDIKKEQFNVKRCLNYGNNKEHINKQKKENHVQVTKDVVDSQGQPLKLKSVVDIMRKSNVSNGFEA